MNNETMFITSSLIKLTYSTLNSEKLYKTLKHLKENKINPETLTDKELCTIYDKS